MAMQSVQSVLLTPHLELLAQQPTRLIPVEWIAVSPENSSKVAGVQQYTVLLEVERLLAAKYLHQSVLLSCYR